MSDLQQLLDGMTLEEQFWAYAIKHCSWRSIDKVLSARRNNE